MTVPGCESMPVQCYRMNGGDSKDVAVGDTISVYGWLMNYNGTIEFKQGCTLTNLVKGEAPEVSEPADGTHLTIAEAIALGETTNKIRVTGQITEIKNTKYGNLYIQDGTGTIYIYGMYDEAGNRFDAMPKQPAVGDTITVYGPVSQFNGEAQIKNAVVQGLGSDDSETPDAPAVDANSSLEEIVEAVKAGAVLDFEYTVSGTVKAVYNNDDGTKNIPIYTSAGQINCNFIPNNGADWEAVAEGDAISVRGVVILKNGKVRVDGGTLVARTPAATEEEPDVTDPETPAEPELTGLAKDMDDASKLANKTYLDRTTTVTGTIISEPKASSYNEGQYNFTISAGGYTITCYYVNVTGGVPAMGSTVTVSGALTAYNGAPQFDSTASATLN